MNQPSREQIEARITALLLGELPANEAEVLRFTISQDVALKKLHDELASTIVLVREAAKTPADAPAEKAEALKLSQERREKLLAHFKTPPPQDPLFWLKRIEVRRLIPVLVVVALAALVAALLLPALSASKSRSAHLTMASGRSAVDSADENSLMSKDAAAAPNSAPTVVTVAPAPVIAPPLTEIVLPPTESPAPVDPATGLPAEEQKLGMISQNVVGYVNTQPAAGTFQLGGEGRTAVAPPTPAAPSFENSGLLTSAGYAAGKPAEPLNSPSDANGASVSGLGWGGGAGGGGGGGGRFDRISHADSAKREFAENKSAEVAKSLPNQAPAGTPAAGFDFKTAVNGDVGVVEKTPSLAFNDSVAEVPADRNAADGSKRKLADAELKPRDGGKGAGEKFYRSPARQAEAKQVSALGDIPVTGGLFQGAADAAAKPTSVQTGSSAVTDNFDPDSSVKRNSADDKLADKSGRNNLSLGVARDSLKIGLLKADADGLRYTTKSESAALATNGGSTLTSQSQIGGIINPFTDSIDFQDGIDGVKDARLNYITQTTKASRIAEEAKGYFTSQGIDLQNPPGKAVFFNDRSNKLLVKATEQDLDIIERAISTNLISPPDFLRSTNAAGSAQSLRVREFRLKPGVSFPLAAPEDSADKSLPKPAANAPIPQPEILTRENNFSTFSLNVSDVSFKLAAASLERGQMPDAASIRSEEFINAFDYRDPEAAAGQPLAFASERARYPFAQNRDLLRFSVKTAAAGRSAGRALNLVLLLDNSGSMERADRVQIIREAMRVLATQLQPQDTVSVITFARTARLWADGVSGETASAVFARVGGITPDGGTNLEEAMRLAYETAHRHYLANGMNRVVLLTDGAANLGNVDAALLQGKVEAQRKQGIALDCFGIGWEGFNDDTLEQLARHGDGRYAFLNSPSDASKEFAAKLAGALQVAASDVKVQVEFNPQRVISYRQIGYAKHQLTKEQFRDNNVDAAEIAAQEAGNALYTIETKTDGVGPIATVRVRYKVPGTTDYRERSWNVEYTGNAVSLEQSTAAMRLAATASAFSEWLATSPFAQEVTPDELLKTLSGVPEIFGADARPKKLEWMIRQAKSISGK